jgi:hypothetical protein
MDVRNRAREIAAGEGQKGAIVITVTHEGVCIGVAGLTSDEVRYALCAAINHSFALDDDAAIDAEDDPG